MSGAIATLSIDLVARMATLQDSLDKAGRLHQKHAAEVEARYAKLKASAAAVATSLAGAFSAQQVVAFLDRTAEAAQTIQRLSTLTGQSQTEFQRMAYGAKTAGIEQDKLADILKDVQDKVGDFLQTGGGGMADFFEKVAPRVGVTADQFRRLNGADALQLYVSSLEKANISQSEMVFYLEAVASDSSLLLPLLQNNGKAFKALGDEAERAGKVMSGEGIRSAVEYRRNVEQLTANLEGLGQSLALTIIPVINQFWGAIQGRDVGGPQVLNQALVVPLQTVAVLAANVAFVFKGVGREIGAIAAQGAALLSGNLEGAKAIRQAVIADGQTARAELDALEKRFFAVGTVVPQASYSNEGRVPVRALSAAPGKGGAPKAIRPVGLAIQEAFAGKLEQSLAKIESIANPDRLISVEEALRGFNNEQERLFELLAATPSADIERQRADMQLLAAAYEEGRLGAVGSADAIAKFTEAVQTRLGTLPEAIKPASDALTEFTLQFQRNAQDIMGETVLATLKGDFASITKLWGNMLLSMASQAVAADLGNKLFPKDGPGILSTIGSLFGFGGGFAKGGAFMGGVPITAFASGGVVGGPTFFGMRGGLGLMGEAGPEAIMPLKRGADGKLGVAGAGGGVTNVYNVAAGVTRNELMTALQLMQQQVEGRVYGTLRNRGLI